MFKWFKKKIKEAPYEFITNPPAKEKRKIEAKNEFLEKIQYCEIFINDRIKSEIQFGRTSYLVCEEPANRYNSKYKFPKMSHFVAYYLAARRFRKRGFKVKIFLEKSPVFNYHTNEKTDSFIYSRQLIISWD